LAELFDGDLVDRVRSPSAGNAIRLAATDLPTVPDFASIEDVSLEIRQRLASNGLIDNCLLHVTRRSSTLLGLWLLAELEGPAKTRDLVLDQPTNRLRISRKLFDEDEGVSSTTASRGPAGLETIALPDFGDAFFGTRAARVENPAIAYLVSLDGSDVDLMETFEARSVLQFSGFGEGLLLLAEFFLNFGNTHCSMNYEYIRSVRGDEIVQVHSCELRVQLADPPNPYLDS